MKLKNDGTPMEEEQPIKRGGIDLDFIKKYNITTDTGLEEYADIMLPFKRNAQKGKEQLSFQKFKNWANLKVSLAGAGKEGNCYRDFIPFTAKEIRQYFSLHVLQGVNPSLQIEFKFRSQH